MLYNLSIFLSYSIEIIKKYKDEKSQYIKTFYSAAAFVFYVYESSAPLVHDSSKLEISKKCRTR